MAVIVGQASTPARVTERPNRFTPTLLGRSPHNVTKVCILSASRTNGAVYSCGSFSAIQPKLQKLIFTISASADNVFISPNVPDAKTKMRGA